ncbi:MAG: T9SS C-terminal target domain-containing protein [Flavobacteriales bacterium]|nr:T9SS C-terminal target domain-containing protein [Flavobacteriales bacterium]
MKNILLFLFLSQLAMAQSYFTPQEVYDFAVGDTLEFSISAGTAFTPFQDYGITRYSIASKTYNSDSSEICYFANSYSMKSSWNNGTGQHDTTRWNSSATWCFTNLDSNLRYLPSYNDASIADTVELHDVLLQYCSQPQPIFYQDTIEDFYGLWVTAPSQVFIMSENCAFQQYVNEVFRPGFGKIRSYSSFETATYTQYNDTTLTYMVKNGISYGYKDPTLGFPEISGPNIHLVNNPVSNLLLVNGYSGPISIVDASGRTLLNISSSVGGVDVGFLEKGNYYIQLTTQGKMLKFIKI